MPPWAILAAGAAVVAFLALPRERRRATSNAQVKVKVRLPSGSCKMEDWTGEDHAAVQMRAKEVYAAMDSPPAIGPGEATAITHDVAIRVAHGICPDEDWPELTEPVYKRKIWYDAAPNWQQQVWDLIWQTSWYVVLQRGQ